MRVQLLRAALASLRAVRSRASLTLGLLGGATLLTGTWAWHREAAMLRPASTWDEAFYSVLGLFFFAGNRLGYPAGRVLRVVYHLAPFVSASALFEAFARILEERGHLFVGSLRGHVVVGGLGNLGSAIARSLDEARQLVVGLECQGDARSVDELRARGAGMVLVGDMTSPETLRRARVHHASAVFLTAKEDMVNLEAAFLVRRIAHGASHPVKVFTHVYDAALIEALDPQLRAVGQGSPIVPFNSYRIAARALVAELLRDGLVSRMRVPGTDLVLARVTDRAGDGAQEPVKRAQRLAEDRARLGRLLRLRPADGERPERFVVVGLGRFGRSVLEELQAHASPRPSFLLLDRAADACEAVVRQLPEPWRERVAYAVGDSAEASLRAQIAAFEPTAVLLCTDNDRQNLRVAADLRRQGLRTVARMFDRDAGLDLDRGLDAQGIAVLSLTRLFRAALPLLLQESRLLGCVDLDFNRTRALDHLFYLGRLSAEERRRMGDACVPLETLAEPGVLVPEELCLLWHDAAHRLDAGAHRA
ncbi:MAG: NAD-binding protein [Deltaproteobacteria bacterium]|nr:NAD-binding protein [Deltaproteobacteria bacterium]